MSTLYRVYEDEIVEANSAKELVEYLARTSKIKIEPAGFRERAAFWLDGLWGQRIRSATDEEFVQDMLSIGRYTVIERR